MDFGYLEDIHQKWQDVLVMDRTFERDGKKYYILGMSLSGENKPYILTKAQLYILEPYSKPKRYGRRKDGFCNGRNRLKEWFALPRGYWECNEIGLGHEKLSVRGEGHRCVQTQAN